MTWIAKLARILIDSQWNREDLFKLLSKYSKKSSTSRFSLADELSAKFPTPPSLTRLIADLQRRKNFVRGFNRAKIERTSSCNLTPTQMRVLVPIKFYTPIPQLPSVGCVAEWLDIHVGLLDWLAEHRKCHYRSHFIQKRSGGMRLVESPRMRLKMVQRQINREILQQIPVHDAAHGFVPGRSAVTAAEPHVGKSVVLRMDMQDFFPGIQASRVFGFFRSLGYPYAVTQSLTDLCTTSCLPRELAMFEPSLAQHANLNVTQTQEMESLYGRKHLPQGAPTSPALANLIAYRLDCRLAGLSSCVGLDYTRYADDLIFSGDRFFGRIAREFSIQVAAIAMEEGFRIQFRKTRIMRSATRQTVTGIVINQRTNLIRSEYDRLKAILHNCVRFGPASQNLESTPHFRLHLQGRINWVSQLNNVRGQKLASIFAKIDWTN